MIRLNKTWVHEDLYYHFLSKFDKSKYTNLTVNELQNFILDNSDVKNAIYEDENGCTSHYAYIVLSVKQHTHFAHGKISELDRNMFRSYYKMSIDWLTKYVYDDETIYKMIDTGEIDENFKLKNERIY